MKQLMKKMSLIFLLIVVLISHLWSGTTGKIAGVVTDKTSGEPLIGVNVVVVGTSLGAATDFNGEYTILQVPPGIYKVQFSSVGYKKIIVDNVRVYVDQTARLDILLESEAIELTETVILGERPIKMDVATSVVDISNSEIKALPASNVVDVIGMQAGIQGMSIRAGSDEQALFMLDGVTLRDPRNNKPITKVALSSVKSISVERGGFNAEYGQVQAGVINVVTNEGKQKGYSGSISVRYTPPAPKYFREKGIPDVYDLNSYWMRPFFDPAVCWTGPKDEKGNTIWDEYTIKQYYQGFKGWNEVSKGLLSDSDPSNDLTPLGAQRAFEYETRKKQINDQPDYEIDAGFGGPVPIVSEALGNLRFFASYRSTREMLLFPISRPDYKDYDGRLVVNSDITKSIKLRLSGQLGSMATMEDNWNKGVYLRYPNEIAGVWNTGGYQLVNMFGDITYSLTDIDYQSYAAKLTHILSDKTYYDVSVEHFIRKYYSRPPTARDTTVKYEIFPGYYETSNPFGYFVGRDVTGIMLQEVTQVALARDNSVASATTLKADVTSQIDFNNMMKAGIEFNYNDLNLDYGFIDYMNRSIEDKYNNQVKMRNFPIRFGAYIQDKLETKGFTLNAGVRFDYSNAQTSWWVINDFDKNLYMYGNDQVLAKKESKGQWQISPRLGISHPITEDSKLYFNYGHFKQMPQYEGLFRLDRRSDNSLARIGDPNLTLAKTISYELGYDHQLFENELLIQVTAFYRDISNQETTTQYFPKDGKSYSVTTSNGYQDVRGFELTLKKSPGPWFHGFINYTYQATSNGHFGNSEWYEDPSRQITDYDLRTDKYYQNRSIPTPYARANLNFNTPADFGPTIFNHHFVGDIMVNLLLNWSQGGWMTYNPNGLAGVVNNVQFVDYYDGTLRVSKGIRIKNLSIQLFADISNLFNVKRLRLSYGDLKKDGDYINSLHLPESEAYHGYNIPGNDKIGDYRTPGVEWQPMFYKEKLPSPKKDDRAIYYEGQSGKYWNVVNGSWAEVDKATIDKINADKAYIFMPNPSTFWFLNPRNITFGLNLSFDID